MSDEKMLMEILARLDDLNQALNDKLDFNTAEKKYMEYSPAWIDTKEVIEEELDTTSSLIKLKGVYLSIESLANLAYLKKKFRVSESCIVNSAVKRIYYEYMKEGDLEMKEIICLKKE
ncbi:ATP-binding protein [Desulfosporosinus shakirovi]|uniref:hypothetical protein n=1 Tax=Desulfosporosinus shakirovi TaxID=2885154 RepID=UPI001E2CECD1|nr:hypothetical protein [Desulfosporosinus sp. SRJS8]MCB8817353.1 hypothetical protein [Desulfosporosinus sp. SRJS8]